MAFSVWEYLRARTRDAVLAGINDALDVAEQGDTNGSQNIAAKQLAARLSGSEAWGIPEPSRNGDGTHVATETRASLLEAPRRPTEPVQLDDELERRIDAAASQGAEERPSVGVPPNRLTNRKRGRPPKTKQGEN